MEFQSVIKKLSSVDKVLIVDKNNHLTSGDFLEQIQATSFLLENMGVSPGTPVLINLNNDILSVVSLFAAWNLGAVAFIGNPFNPVESVTQLVNKFRIHTITGSNAAIKALQIQLKNEFALIDDEKLSYCTSGKFAALTIPDNQHNLHDKHPSSKNATVAIFSSGSTGEPKAILNSFSNICKNALSHAEAICLSSDDVVGCVLPIFYSYGLVANLISAIAKHAKVVLQGTKTTIDNSWVEQHSVSVIALTPYFAKDIVISAPTLRVMTLGGDALHISTAKKIRESHPQCELYSTYGLTEAGPRVATWRFDNCDDLPSHRVAPLGKPLSCCDFNLGKRDKHRKQVELFVNTGTRMLGYYYGYDQGTLMPDWPEHVVKTGDLFEEIDGYYFFVGRDKDIIVQNGEKIFPAVIEAHLLNMDEIVDARVVGLSDSNKGEIAEVFIHAKREIDTNDIKRFLLSHLPHASLPIHYHLVDKIKRTETGKRVRRSHFIQKKKHLRLIER